MLPRRALSNDLLNGCHDLISGVLPSYGYKPSLAAGAVFCVLFFVLFIGHIFRAFQFRKWTSYVLATGALVEFLGWAGRTWSSQCPYNQSAFLMQITTLVIAPVFFAAACYLVLGQLIMRHGAQYSLLRPRLYLWIFCTGDVIALLVQAAGAGIASHEFNELKGDTTRGTHIVLGGLAFQLLSMSAFIICFAVYLFRSHGSPTPRAETLVVFATITSIVVIYIRCVYRTAQLAQGWTGYLSRHEGFFVGLDAAMMVIAVAVYNIFDPASLLQSMGEETDVTAGQGGNVFALGGRKHNSGEYVTSYDE